MSNPLEPDKIIEKAIKGTITKSDAADILISLIEESDNSKIRADSIIGLDKIAFKSEIVFKFIENHLISDKNPYVRNAAAQVITHHYVKDGLNSLKYAITHDPSPLVMKTIFEFIRNFSEHPLEFLNEELNRWIEQFALNIGVAQEEAKFFLDLEALFANGNEHYELDTSIYKYFKGITDYKSGEPWLAFKNNHVEILNFNYFNWKFLKENQDNIEPFMKLNSPDLFLSSIKKLNPNSNNSLKIPHSIGLLKHLKILNLNRNNITSIPESIGSLPSIEKLDLSHNHICEISDSICNLISLKILNLSHNNITSIPSCIQNLEGLSELRIHKNKLKSVPDYLDQFLNSLEIFSI